MSIASIGINCLKKHQKTACRFPLSGGFLLGLGVSQLDDSPLESFWFRHCPYLPDTWSELNTKPTNSPAPQYPQLNNLVYESLQHGWSTASCAGTPRPTSRYLARPTKRLQRSRPRAARSERHPTARGQYRSKHSRSPGGLKKTFNGSQFLVYPLVMTIWYNLRSGKPMEKHHFLKVTHRTQWAIEKWLYRCQKVVIKSGLLDKSRIAALPSLITKGYTYEKSGIKLVCFFPTCQVRVVRFYVSCLPLLLVLLLLLSSPLLSFSSSSSSSSSNCDPRSTLFGAGPQSLPSMRSVPCRTSTTTIHASVLCRTSTTTIHAQCSLPDLNRDHPRPMFPAGPQPRVSPPSVPCRTSTATIHAQCSLPDLNREYPRPVFPAGPQRDFQMSEKMSDRMPDRMSEEMPDRMSEDMPERMSEDMSDRMPDRMPEYMPEYLSDRLPEYMSE